MEVVMDEASDQSLDPFEFHGHPASCIEGLGGSTPLPDPTYAFHTSYVPVARGHAHFTVKFTDLQARRGSLILRVHMLSGEPGANAQMATSHRVQLNWLAHHGGEVQLRFEAFRGARYALMGVVPDQLDASATGLSVTLDRPATEDDLAETAVSGREAQSTAFGSETVKGVSVPLLLSLDVPSFAHPVSQPCTNKQLRETALAKRLKPLASLPADPVERWQIGYAIQSLERYGMLQEGARGLVVGEVHPAVLTTLANAGAAFRQVLLRQSGLDGQPAVMDPAEMPGELFAFDFLLSVRAVDRMESGKAGAAFIERMMESLRPSGLAVNIVGFHPAPETIAIAAFDRNGLERLAVAMISRGHQMARMKPPLVPLGLAAGADGVVPFGLVARRAALIR